MPLTSLEGAIGVLLYGMAVTVEEVGGRSGMREWLLAEMGLL